MAEITKFPVEKVHPEIVGAREIWDQAEPPQEMVWAICPHVRSREDESRCHHCPPWEEDPDYGKMRRGCYGMAAETCRIVFAMQSRPRS